MKNLLACLFVLNVSTLCAQEIRTRVEAVPWWQLDEERGEISFSADPAPLNMPCYTDIKWLTGPFVNMKTWRTGANFCWPDPITWGPRFGKARVTPPGYAPMVFRLTVYGYQNFHVWQRVNGTDVELEPGTLQW